MQYRLEHRAQLYPVETRWMQHSLRPIRARAQAALNLSENRSALLLGQVA